MAAIYDKALKRKDLSGIVKDKEQVVLPDQKKKKGEEQKDENDPKSGADVGKIVNLMAGDANKVSGRCIPPLILVSRPVSLPDLSADLKHVLDLRRAVRTLDWVHIPVPVSDHSTFFSLPHCLAPLQTSRDQRFRRLYCPPRWVATQ